MGTREARGFTLIEVLIAMGILVVGLLALLGLLSQSSVSVEIGGGQSKATSYARQQAEFLRNRPVTDVCFAVGCANVADTPEVGITRTWTVAAVGATIAPNRLWRITVIVNVRQSGTVAGAQSITVETMRAE